MSKNISASDSQKPLQPMLFIRHIQAILIILILLTGTNEIKAKPLLVVVEDLIGSSKFAGQVVITGYNSNDKILFKSTDYKDTISVAIVGEQMSFIDFFFSLRFNNWTGYYPRIGDSVFIVIDENDLVRIFGKKIKNDYRLWSPLLTLSIAIFEYSEPLKPIDSSRVMVSLVNTVSCWDGCLMPIKLTNSLITKYRQKFKKKLHSIKLKTFVGQSLGDVLYNDTLSQYINLIWVDKPPRKLKTLQLTYTTGETIEIILENNKNEPIQFEIKRNLYSDEFEKLKIKVIKWKIL